VTETFDLWEQVMTDDPANEDSGGQPLPPQEVDQPARETSFEENVADAVPAEPQILQEEVAWEPHLLGFHEDTSDLTDEQVLECLALVPIPWVEQTNGWQATDEVIAKVGRAYVGKRRPTPIRRPGKQWTARDADLSKEDFIRHFTGKHLLGAYLLDAQNCTGVAVADIDAEGEEFRERLLAGDHMAVIDLLTVSRVVGGHMATAFGSGVHVTLTGGKGAHVVYVLPERSPAAIVRRQMRWMSIAAGWQRVSDIKWEYDEYFMVEGFPKQDTAGDGLGNLIRLPHGTDPGTGRPALVVRDNPHSIQETVLQPMYRGDPATPSDRSRREVQHTVDSSGGTLGWVESYLGDKYVTGLKERCEALLGSAAGGVQMANAVGQVIHIAGWGDWVHASGLLNDLEAVAETL
jgi:hypothetical protein